MNVSRGQPQWHAARLGKMTGSRIADATARTKTGWGASRDAYKAELVNERLTACRPSVSSPRPMQDGIDREPDAIVTYEFERNAVVALVGFVPHPRIAMAGCSPDGLLGRRRHRQHQMPDDRHASDDAQRHSRSTAAI